ncbi:MAG: GGDEF domain-containing protein [Armatimonadetes bacterium]|nr:GGDEF domain-containing protein [Armatimonadota bacterium]
MERGRPKAEDIARRARQIVDERLGRIAVISGPRLVGGRWEISVWCGPEGQWMEIARLRFDGLGRFLPVPWAEVYERFALALCRDPAGLSAVPGLCEPPIAHLAAGSLAIDPRTGLPSLAAWDARVRREQARSRRHGEAFSVGWARLRLDPVCTRTLGHAGLNALWQLCATRLQKEAREEDFIAAAGPGEFAFVMAGDELSAVAAVRRLSTALRRPVRMYEEASPIRPGLVVAVSEVSAEASPVELAEAMRRAINSVNSDHGDVVLVRLGGSVGPARPPGNGRGAGLPNSASSNAQNGTAKQ